MTRRLLRARTGCGRRVVTVVVLWFAATSCGGPRMTIDPDGRCALLDSLYRGSGFSESIEIAGRATIDADQRRLRGKFRLVAEPGGDLSLDFTSTILFGTQREDFLLSVVRDTLRIIDRERGAYYESSDADRFVVENLSMEFDARRYVSLALGRVPDCGRLGDLAVELKPDGAVHFTGNHPDGEVEILFEPDSRRLKRLVWPVRLGNDDEDRLRIEYRWEARGRPPALREVVLWLDDREWRCRLEASTY